MIKKIFLKRLKVRLLLFNIHLFISLTNSSKLIGVIWPTFNQLTSKTLNAEMLRVFKSFKDEVARKLLTHMNGIIKAGRYPTAECSPVGTTLLGNTNNRNRHCEQPQTQLIQITASSFFDEHEEPLLEGLGQANYNPLVENVTFQPTCPLQEESSTNLLSEALKERMDQVAAAALHQRNLKQLNAMLYAYKHSWQEYPIAGILGYAETVLRGKRKGCLKVIVVWYSILNFKNLYF